MIANASKNANNDPGRKQCFLVRIGVLLSADFANHDTPDWPRVGVTVCKPSQQRNARPRRTAHGSLRRVVRPRHLVDDALDDDDLNVNVAGYVGLGLGDEVVDGSGGQADGVALGAGETSGSIRKLV
jgi:hypothetical protein